MAENIIALMFPEYDDIGNPVTSKDWTTDELYDDKTFGIQIKEAGIFVDFFKDEECCMVYDSENIKAYLYAVKTLPECYPSRVGQLRTVLKGMKDWRKHRCSSESTAYNIHNETIKNEVRTEIASRIESTPANSFLIATNVFGNEGKNWELKTIDKAPSITVNSLPMSISHVFEWLSNHHKPLRVYEWNEKHGENGRGAHPNNKGEEVSVLESSREHAEELLPRAIGFPNYDTLYCYDVIFNKYMEYKAGCKFERLSENTIERKYHSFHINDKNRVPKRIVDKIKTLQKLSK